MITWSYDSTSHSGGGFHWDGPGDNQGGGPVWLRESWHWGNTHILGVRWVWLTLQMRGASCWSNLFSCHDKRNVESVEFRFIVSGIIIPRKEPSSRSLVSRGWHCIGERENVCDFQRGIALLLYLKMLSWRSR